ncbi:recombination protein RecR [bacterium DOLZORAL124_38_8]|nr:MAG: recombination protein RecR [bacterium DOLZORAL124_38_8]
MMLPDPIQNAIEALSDLPGIGKRSAERLVFTLLKNETGLSKKIGENLLDLKEQIHRCCVCGNYCESTQTQCPICQNHHRESHIICVVESPLDVIAIEKTHEYRGQYHVLHGVLSPMNRVHIEDLNIKSLFERLNDDITEIILATSGTTESEATALYLHEQLSQKFAGNVSRLSRGIPSGGDLDFLDTGTLTRALLDRRSV